MALSFASAVRGSLDGKKSYLLAGLAVVYAVAGFFLDKVQSEEVVKIVWFALFGSALRAGVGKK